VNGNGTTGNPSWATNDVYAAGGGTNFKTHTWAGAFIGNDNQKFNDQVHSHPLNARDADASHNNMPPWLAVHWLIRTGTT
jgi:hypothetical protein